MSTIINSLKDSYTPFTVSGTSTKTYLQQSAASTACYTFLTDKDTNLTCTSSNESHHRSNATRYCGVELSSTTQACW